MAPSRILSRVVLTVALALATASAAAQVQWYEHYQHGIELEGQSSWEPALREFEAAARAEPRPRKRVPTYGRNLTQELRALGSLPPRRALEIAADIAEALDYAHVKGVVRDPLPARDGLVRPVPERVWSIVERLCAKSPGDRYPTAESLLVELHTVLRDFSTLGGDRA